MGFEFSAVRAVSAVVLALVVAGCSGGPEPTAESSRPPQPEHTPQSDGGRDQRKRPQRPLWSSEVQHPLVPLTSVPFTVFSGAEADPSTGQSIDLRVESRLLDKTERVAGVRVAVVDVREYRNDELVEHTLDYYAERRDGSVWYFGERVADFQNGEIVGHSGQWLAGRGNARRGLFMPAHPKVNQTFQQERAPGVAEDRSTVVARGVRVRTPLRRFSNCIKTRDVAPLDNVTEFKYYCSGVGLVREEGIGEHLELVRYR